MTQLTRHINYKSDFILRERFRDKTGNLVPLPDVDFEIRYWVRPHHIFVASRIGGVYTNCIPDGDAILVVFKNHGLCEGPLKRELYLRLDNDLMPDGVQDSYSTTELSVLLWQFASDSDGVVESDVLAAYTRGRAFTYDDFTQQQLQDLKKPAADAAEQLRKFQASAVDNEALRVKAEAVRQEAEDGRVNAETARAEEFALWENEIDSKADRSELSNVLASEPLTPGNFPDINAYTREELKMDLFIDMWNQAWGEYGRYDPDNAPDAQHPFMGNEIWMTYEEALDVYNLSIVNRNQASNRIQCFIQLDSIRTLLPFREVRIQRSWQQAFLNCRKLEVVSGGFNVSNGVQMFHGCEKLRKVLPWIILENCSNVSEMFYNCYELETLDIRSINIGINLSQSPLWRLESVKYAIDNRPAHFVPKAITITVHPQVYAKLTDETNTEWHALLALAAEKNINFATT